MNKHGLRRLAVAVLALALMLGLAIAAQAKSASRISLNRKTLSMDWNTSYTLTATVSPAKADDKDLITWSVSDDSGLVTVTQDASNPRKAVVRVRAKTGAEAYPGGAVKVTAETAGGKKAACVISIKQVNLKSLNLSPSSKTLYLTTPRTTYTIKAPSFTPAVAGDQSYAWSSNNESVATVEDVEGDGVVTLKGEGKARIYATHRTAAGKIVRDYVAITVKAVRVKSISLSESTLYIGEGETTRLTASLKSAVSGKTPSYGTISWASEDEAIATVDENGLITAKQSGIVKITASADTGKYAKSASCQVYVRDANPTRVTITAGGDVVLGGDPRKGSGVITARSTQERYEKLVKQNGDLYPFEKIAKLFSDTGATGRPNLSVVNVEVCLTSKASSSATTTRKYLFGGSPENAKALNVGVDVANIANNHTADFGVQSFRNTKANIEKYSAAKASGLNTYDGNSPYVPVFTVGGRRIGFYGAQINQLSYAKVPSRIKKAKESCDLLVVSFHWTGEKEHVRNVTSRMRSYARKAIDAGADLVIGTHRHESSGIEKYKGKYIIYDMGNLVTGGASSPFTYMVQVDFDISESFAETASSGGQDAIRIYPLYTSSDPTYVWNKKKKKYERDDNNWQPVPVESAVEYLDKDTGEAVKPADGWASVANIINKYSPKGTDGKKFSADGYMKSYSTLP